MTTGRAIVHGRYRLGGVLGAGGMGCVWAAHDEFLDRAVALKEIMLPDDEFAPDRDALRRQTLHEARAAARLTHPAVARVYDAFEEDGRAWIVMEHVSSRSLQEVLDADGPLAPDRAARIGLEVLAALAAAHAAGVRHRDVKPSNVLLGDDGRVVLTDFGVAAVDGESIATSSGRVVGSPQYMAPERVLDGAAGAESDLWSLGATLYAAVEGRSPYDRGTVMEIITAIATDEPDPPSRAGALAPVFDGLLRKDPAGRIDAEETERLLRAVVAPPAGTPRPARRRPAVLAAIAAVVLIAGGASTAWLAQRPDPGGTKPGPATTRPSSVTDPGGAAPPAATTADPSGSALPPLPDGWTDYRDPTGFALYVPDGWTRTKEGSIVYFRSQGRVLGIDQTDEPAPDPVDDWRGKADYRVERGDFPGYREIRIVAVGYFREAADWEYTFDGPGSRRHVNNRGFVTSQNQAYGIYWQTSDAAWDGARGDLELIFESFRPARS